ncbi:protein of unknown function [Nitrospira japonica]|uniref:Uncharacterized protein n=1 Tax=Nitrospira japonica TaxID=1325564 RepID=A0A1W1HZZ7_9BACT|nr:protein of unknown function [Nitrospira japonica]
MGRSVPTVHRWRNGALAVSGIRQRLLACRDAQSHLAQKLVPSRPLVERNVGHLCYPPERVARLRYGKKRSGDACLQRRGRSSVLAHPVIAVTVGAEILRWISEELGMSFSRKRE